MAGLFNSLKKNVGGAISNIASAASEAGKTISEKASQAGEYLTKVANDSGVDISAVSASVHKRLNNAGSSVLSAIDQNGNGQIDIEDIVILVLKTPGMKINRAEYLETQLKTKYPQDTVDQAIALSPIKAGVPLEELDQLAAACIAAEADKAYRVSKDRSIPEGVAIVSTYGFMLRTVQELLYLYGFPDLGLSHESETIDAGVQNILILCIGSIYGIEGANDAIRAVAKAMGTGVEKFLLQKALTQGAIHPFVVNVGKWFAKKMAKEVGAGLLKKIPFAGGLLADSLLGTGLTKFSFVTSCSQLKDVLRDTYFTRGDIPGKQEEDVLVEMVEAGKKAIEEHT
ncbi:MAG: hypothetical protein E7325_11635 [Clostridiales bacterium]|nr:hypothetical protein [Clostridiales bacterium]